MKTTETLSLLLGGAMLLAIATMAGTALRAIEPIPRPVAAAEIGEAADPMPDGMFWGMP